jgi:hypothetical protein
MSSHNFVWFARDLLLRASKLARKIKNPRPFFGTAGDLRAFIDQKLQAASSLTTTLSACTTVKIIISGRKVTIGANAVNRISFVEQHPNYGFLSEQPGPGFT